MKKKILFINGHMNTGGVEKTLLDILINIDYSKYDVDLYLLEEIGEYGDDIPPYVNIILCSLKDTYGPLVSSLVKCLKNKNWKCFCIRILFFLKRFFGKKIYPIISFMLFNKKKYDVAISARTGICADIILNSNVSNQKYLWWHHGDFGLFSKEEVKKNILRFDKIIAVSIPISKFLKENIPEIKEKIVIIENGIDIEKINKLANIFNPYELNKDKFIICSIGRINPEKRYDLVVDVAHQLKIRNKINFIWYLIGDGIEYNFIKEKVKQYNLENEVIMLGSQKNPYPYIKNSNIFVHTSDVESFGIVILEAMCLKIPCIVTKSLGPQSYIKSGVNGVLVNSSIEEIVTSIENVYNNYSNFIEIAYNGYRTANHYDVENMVNKFNTEILEKGNKYEK